MAELVYALDSGSSEKSYEFKSHWPHQLFKKVMQTKIDKEYIVIDTTNWARNTIFNWFKSFNNPTYSFGVKIDVDNIIFFSKKTNTSFFINFLYIVTRVCNEIEPLRLRFVDNKVLLFNRIDPTFTVKTTDGFFNNAGFVYTSNYQSFYKLAKEEIEKHNGLTENPKNYNSDDYGVFYSSCITSIDLENFREPLNSDDKNSINVPRIFWDKYRLEDEKNVLLLNFTVSHILIDGEDLSKAFNLIRKYCLDFESIISN